MPATPTVRLLSDSIHALGHGELVMQAITGDAGLPIGSLTICFAVHASGPRYEVRTSDNRNGVVDWDRSADFFTPHAAVDFAYACSAAVRAAELESYRLAAS